MDLKQLQAFDVVSQELHFTRAADRLGIAQPTLSLQIRALEESYGIPLFDRTGKRVVLTQAGLIFSKYVKEILQALRSAEAELNDLKHLHTGSLVVGMLTGDLDFRLSDVLIDFRREFPNIKLSLHGPVDVREMVLQNEADIGLTALTQEDAQLVQIPLIHETFGVVAHKSHPIAECSEIALSGVTDLPLILFPRGLVGRELLDAYCSEHAILYEPSIETSTVPSIINLVRHRLGVSVLSKQLVDSIGFDDLRFVPIVDPTPTRDIGIIYRKDRYLSHAARTFIRRLLSHLSND